MEEVRRYYPFFPLMAGLSRKAFNWRDLHFEKNTWVFLDPYGTNRDSRIWENPERFWPERFESFEQNEYNFIPQGAGDYHHGHRCPGEWFTIELMKRSIDLFTSAMQYDVPKQNLEVIKSKMPMLLKSGFVINHVQRA